MLDEIDVDEGLAEEERTHGDWVETDLEDAGAVQLFGHELDANVVKMEENGCNSCLHALLMMNVCKRLLLQ